MSFNTVVTTDHVQGKLQGLELLDLERFLSDIEYQPVWRPEAQRAADYYDGKQMESLIIKTIEERGQAPLIFNLVAPAIDGVLGMEAKTRVDWIVRADNDDGKDVAEGLNEKLNEAMRQVDANRACSDAYAAQVKTGAGWVELNRNSNPFQSKYRCNYVHRDEIYFDWYAKKPDLSDARWLVRHRWLDEDQAIAAFPEHKNLVQNALNGWGDLFRSYSDVPEALLGSYQTETSSNRATHEYYDYGRRRLKVYEVWYRQWVKDAVITTSSGRAIRYDPKNTMHRAAVQSGSVQVSKAMFPVMRMSYFLGPHRVLDIASPLPHDQFPYIPFWGFREDGTGIPYGLIRRMMSPQDEINARRSKMMWLLTARSIFVDDDATDMTLEEIVEESARPDGVFRLNAKRRNHDAIRIEQQWQLANQQFQIMKDAEEMIQNTSGIYNSMLGRNDEAQSGVAISSLVEQASTTLAELNDNYRYARRLVGEQMLAMIVQDIGESQEEVVLNVNRPEKTRKVMLNERNLDGAINNDVTRTKAKVILDDITATAGYRAQIANRMMEIIGTLPDDLKAPLMPLAIEATDLPQRDKMVQVLNRVLGTDIDPETMSEEERAQYEAEMQQKAKERELAMAEMEGKLEELRAKTENLKAEASTKEYDNRKKEADTEKVLTEIDQLRQEMEAMRKGRVEEIDAENTRMEAQNLLSATDIAGAVA